MPTLGGFLSLFSRGLHVASVGSSEHGGVGAATLTLLTRRWLGLRQDVQKAARPLQGQAQNPHSPDSGGSCGRDEQRERTGCGGDGWVAAGFGDGLLAFLTDLTPHVRSSLSLCLRSQT